jgi:trehalose/maltose hydrolase-like predicted phosphorylase
LAILQQALQSDVADVQGGTTAEGIHLGAMAGTVDLVLRCLTGMRAHGQVLRFDPAIPTEIKRLRFSVHYRGHRVELVFSEDRLEISSRPGPAAPITILVREQTMELYAGARHTLLTGLRGEVTGIGLWRPDVRRC